ncbi:hypothetical protein NT6N_35110 [Oceaniferula spumae]|uniref:Uncharacterized protein n=1 Tax=Oceaniferula spumae TaxID=2979115 RepID=A0AAT9FR22_9BACT
MKITIMTACVFTGAQLAGIATAQVTAPKTKSLNVIAEKSHGKWSNPLRNQILSTQRTKILEQLKAAGVSIDPKLQAWVDSDETARAAVYGAIYPANPHVLKNLNTLYSELGEKMFHQYEQFCLGTSVARREIGVGRVNELSALSKTVAIAKTYLKEGKDPSVEFAREVSDAPKSMTEQAKKLGDYLEEKGITAQQAWDSEEHAAALAKLLNVSDAGHGKGRANGLEEVMRDYITAKKVRPVHRTPRMSIAEFLRHLDKIQNTDRSELSLSEDQPWPLFPLTKTPWPLLMPLAISMPKDEADYIWEKYNGKHGDKRLHTYGPYTKGRPRGDIGKEMTPSAWHWKSYPSKIDTGGVCGTMSFISRCAQTALGVPVSSGGQPGHGCPIRYAYDSKSGYSAAIEQSATAGPENSYFYWHFDMPAHRTKFGGTKKKTYAEYQFGLTQGMNVGLESYMDTHIANHLFLSLDKADQTKYGRSLLLSSLKGNPFNAEAWYNLASSCQTQEQLDQIIKICSSLIAGNNEIKYDKPDIVPADTDLSDRKEGRKALKKLDGAQKNSAFFRHIVLKHMQEIGSKSIKQ